MANINRDYLIVLDVKSSVISEADELKYYITDEHSQNLFVNLVVRDIEHINKYVQVHDPEKYELELHIVKPNNDIVRPHLQANLLSVPDALYAFQLPKEAVDYIGTYKCELRVTYKETDETTITTSNKFKYKVKRSIYNDLDSIQDAPQYPVVIQLFDKLSDIEQYEEDRRANELARQLAEEQRQIRFDALDTDMTDSIEAMDNKVVEVENRISTKEQAVDKLIVDTKADIDNYKVAKDQEIDEYKATKDTEINNAITAQDNKIEEAINAQNDRIAVVENNDTTQNNRLDALENRATQHESRLTDVEAKNTEQDGRLDIVENKNQQQDNRLDVVEAKNVEQDNRLNEIEAIDVAQNTRLDAIEVKNQQQDDRLLDIEKVNKRQDIDLKCLFTEAKNNMIDITEEGNNIYLQNSTTGHVFIDNIQGNTLVNCNKEPDKELILNGNINTSGDNNITITEGVDGGLVDVALEGNTLVNVSKTKDSTAISKAYTVENSGNHIALQGDVNGSCRPVITGNTLVNLVTNGEDSKVIKYSSTTKCKYDYNYQLKSNSDYTLIFEASNIPSDNSVDIHASIDGGFGSYMNSFTSNGNYIFKFSTRANVSKCNSLWIFYLGTNSGDLGIINNVVLLEGDYTNKPIPDYFEGLQSSFEDNLVTQEMVDSGEEEVGNLGKYKADYIVTGKNKANDNGGYTTVNWMHSHLEHKVCDLGLIVGKTYTMSCTLGLEAAYRINIIGVKNSKETNLLQIGYRSTFGTFTLDSEYDSYYISAYSLEKNKYVVNIQVEEGDTATAYEPYKEYTKTLYLNSPLLEGDTIEEKDDGIYHVHRSELVAYTEGDEASLITDKVNTLHQLAEPQYELIEQSNLVIPSYANGHLDLTSAVPVEKVEFKPFIEELTYLYANTQYTVQFVSDKATTVDITLGGTQLLSQSIVAGLNRITITTPATLADNKLVINGVGANISEVVVTDTDREFMYFEGMKSVGECEELEVKSGNKNILNPTKNLKYPYFIPKGTKLTLSTKDGVPSEGGNVLLYDINGNIQWFPIDSGESTNTITTSKDIYYMQNQLINDDIEFQVEIGNVATSYVPYTVNTQQLTHEPLRAVGNAKDRYVLIDGKWYIERNCGEVVLDGVTNSGFTRLKNPEAKNGYTKYPLTRNDIKENSNIICETLIKASDVTGGTRPFSCIITKTGNYKLMLNLPTELAGTTDTSINNYLQNNNIKIVMELATPTYEPIDYNPLEVYSGTTHITTNSVIPTNITVKNHGFNCLLKPSTTYTISSNLGLNTVTTPSVLTEDCLRFMDTDTSDVTTMRGVLVLEGDWTTKADLIPANFSGIESAFEQEYDAEKGKYKVNIKVTNEDKTKENNITFYINEPLRGVRDVKDRVFIKDDKVVVQRNCGIRAYKDGDFGTYPTDKVNTVYPLAEPAYEEIEYNDTKLFIESFKNSTLSYNSNVPVTSKLYYSYSVPIVDTVAQTANVTDQQDSMIIDLATQVAVMEMMLM